jgi:Protein of unknown function (DUF1488)
MGLWLCPKGSLAAGNGNKDKLKVFKANRDRIEHEARRKYLADLVESDGSVLIKTMDL